MSENSSQVQTKPKKFKIKKVEKTEIDEEKYKITDNVDLYIGDSIDISKKYENMIDLIYMDPPYDTNRNFTLDSKSNTTGFSDKWDKNQYELWLNNLIKSLKITLKHNGSLVIHISSENSFIIEKILNLHFKNIEKIYWKRCHGKNTVKNKFGAVIDILFVAYDSNRIFNQINIPIEENSVWAFKNKDDRGLYSLGSLKHDRTRKGHEYTITYKEIEYKNEFGWKLNEETVKALIEDNRIHFVPKSNNMYIKVYKHEHKGIPLSNLWNDIHSITRTNKDPRLYPTQKPQKLIERIIKIFSNENSLIMDPVCGSGTTGFVADKINRKCIMVDINKDVLPIITKRFNDKIYNI
jgi:adenine-specific DNA-methyltransferase